MRRFLMFILVVAILGGGGYYGYNHFYKKPSQTAAAVPKNKEKEVVKPDETKKIEPKDAKDVEQGVSTDKTWEFSFDDKLDSSTVNTSNIVVTDTNGKKVAVGVNLINQNKTIQITPPSNGYKKGEYYKLHIENGGVMYANGKPVSKPYDSTFLTKRDKVVKATYNKNLIKVNDDEYEIVADNTIKINKNVKKDLKKGDILVIPTNDSSEGEAFKVKTIDSNLKSFTVTVEKPSFPELFDKLDIYNTYEIKPENIELNSELQGAVTLDGVAQIEPHTQIASSAKVEKKGEYQKNILVNVSKARGLQFSIKKLPIGGKDSGVKLNGSLNVFTPEVNTDIDINAGSFERFYFTTKVHSEQNVTLTKDGYKKELKDTDFAKVQKQKRFHMDEKVRIASVDIPIVEAPGLVFTGEIFIEVNYSVTGKPQISLTLESDAERGLVYEKNHKPDIIYKNKNKANYSFQGTAHAEAYVGPNLYLRLSALKIYGGAINGLVAAKVSGDFTAGTSKDRMLFTCANGKVGGILEGTIGFDKGIRKHNYIVSYDFGTIDFLSKSFNTCNTFEDIISSKTELLMKADETKDINVYEKIVNLLNQSHSRNSVDSSKLKIVVEDKDVLQVNKTKNGISVKSTKVPKKGQTNIILTYVKDNELFRKDKTASLTIPVTITNYDEVKKQAEEEKKKKEKEEASKLSLNGTWSRNIRNSEGTLNISNATGQTFDFTLETYFGANMNGTEGKAKISGTKATFVDPEFGCKLVFDLGKDAINIDESTECSQLGGIGASLAGKYDKGTAKKSTKSFSDLGVLTAKDDANVKKLVGNDYETLVSNMQIINTDEEDKDNMNSTIITGGVAGLYTFKEGIIQFDKKGYYYVGLIVDDSKVRFYSNNPEFKNTMTFTELYWMNRFNYPVETIYKDI